MFELYERHKNKIKLIRDFGKGLGFYLAIGTMFICLFLEIDLKNKTDILLILLKFFNLIKLAIITSIGLLYLLTRPIKALFSVLKIGFLIKDDMSLSDLLMYIAYIYAVSHLAYGILIIVVYHFIK